ncbi:MAG TPA: NAD-glutamate dehydrogenase [Xanthobacteraceae bacterium]|nr:NAD-glutamate dehydrogenase [Xanthobacteraceae bacterium]
MDSDAFHTSNEESAARELVRQASLLAEEGGDLPRGFVAALFGRAAPEDLVIYSAHEIAALARLSFDHLKARTFGAPSIRISNPPAVAGSKPLANITVVEICNDDMPFLLDSVVGEIAAQELTVRLVLHPVFTVERDKAGKPLAWKGEAPAKAKDQRESFIHIHVDRIDQAHAAALEQALQATLGEVRVAVSDWKKMREEVQTAISELKKKSSPLPKEEVSEAAAFLEWLLDDNFTFLGSREYVFGNGAETSELEPADKTGLGILRASEVRVLKRGRELMTMTPEIREFMRLPVALIITKSNVRSRVHRRLHMDYIGVKRFDTRGKLAGELRIVGLFTSGAYMRSARDIPTLRPKIERVIARAGFAPESHSGKALLNVLETYPRDELFQIDDDLLYQNALAILELEERPRVRVLARRDRFDRFVSILAYVPRERYDSTIRARLGDYFAEVYKGRLSAFHPYFSDGALTRVHFIIGRDEGETPDPDRATLEAAVGKIVRNWSDGFAQALAAHHEQSQAHALNRRYREAFSAIYRDAFDPETAVADIRVLETLSRAHPFAIHFYRRDASQAEKANLKVWCFERPVPLSERVPVLEHMGFSVINERTYTVDGRSTGAPSAYLHDMTLARKGGGAVPLEALDQQLESALIAVMSGRAEDDGFNALVLAAGMAWRDVALLRTLGRYLRQTTQPFSQDYLWTTLAKHAAIAEKIVALFHARFDPRIDLPRAERAKKEAAIAGDAETALNAVESLDEDRILRQFFALVRAAIRTNFYQIDRDGHPKAVISIKFESRKIDVLPLPRPLYEIFVYSPRVEGVHLRFGKVARGGIRWSDRPQDFRTEILGLVKAQQVKNAVIVPVGAKGGFVPKKLPAAGGREAILAEGIAAYDIFITSLLELTDNIEAGGIVHPANTVLHDGDDPYLVVAADKGTATFSDAANAIAIRHGFWLGDAFASGGSAGYDHKKMGITARGAWESVKRHFREMDIDIRKTPFTVSGVGDMSGDVFGNGMLLEKTIKLVAAFDHRDIFIDPSPDPERALSERRRLFDLPRSSWQDYDKTLISKGGGVFPRSSKSIPLSFEARTLLDISKSDATPAEVMHAILKAPVDLLWFGGIGTYVRASSEADDKVGDRANDAIRVSGKELRCKVVGEGANLGVTQRGRIEAAEGGVRINTDAIDNSAGVNTSDVEVNIKIALSAPVREGKLSNEARNELLASMTTEVGHLVLRNNYLQTLALSLAERCAADDLGFENRLMQMLEARDLLDRGVEFLPSDADIAKRREKKLGLTRPEIAVMLAYAKITLFDDLISSNVPDDPYFARELIRYFPRPLSERFPEAVNGHRLRREIIATMLSNSIINRGGPSFVARIADETGANAAEIAAAFAAVRDSYRMTELNGEIDALDAKISGKLQLSLYAAVQDLLLDRIIWFLRNAPLKQGLAGIVSHYRAGIEETETKIEAIMPADARADFESRAAKLVEGNVPEALARRIARLPLLAAATDVILIADQAKKPVEEAAETYFAAREFLKLETVVKAAQELDVPDRFDRLALDHALGQIAASERQLTAVMLSNGMTGKAALDAWIEPRRSEVERTRARIREIASTGFTLSKLTVAASLVSDLVKN